MLIHIHTFSSPFSSHSLTLRNKCYVLFAQKAVAFKHPMYNIAAFDENMQHTFKHIHLFIIKLCRIDLQQRWAVIRTLNHV